MERISLQMPPKQSHQKLANTGIPSRASGIANAAFQATASGVELFTDIVRGVYDDEDEYDGIAGQFGVWNDNVLGEGGVVQNLLALKEPGGHQVRPPEYDRQILRWLARELYAQVAVLYLTLRLTL